MQPSALLALTLALATTHLPNSLAAQVPAPAPLSPPAALARADTNRLGRILQAEDERDSTAGAFDDGFRSRDPRTRLLARVALARTRDPKFASRDSFPKLAPPPKYAEPAWRLRYRALGHPAVSCAALRRALGDSAWAVRLRALDLATPACARESAFVATVRAWAGEPPKTSARQRGGASWQPAGHAIVALARLDPKAARVSLPAISGSSIPWLRAYAARAAGVLADTATLLRLARDDNDNVKEVALDQLARIPGHVADDEAIAALAAPGYQAVRAAARALKGSPRGHAVFDAAFAAAERLRDDSSETSRDARLGALERIAEFARVSDADSVADLTGDFDCVVAHAAEAIATKLGRVAAAHCKRMPIVVPPEAIAIALGRPVSLRVTLADSSGGGSFTVRLRGDAAPIMAARVLALVRAHWYDDRPWFRVEPDFVIEGGGPGANEYVGDKRFMRDELSTLPHVRGTVGMSTRGHDTGDGQWFVNLRDNDRLTRDYTAFGEVTDGIDVVDGVLEGDVIARIEVVGER